MFKINDFVIKLTQLDNGLKVVTDTVDTVETVTLGVWINTGARDEKLNENGISHFLEHMAFKGTTSRTAKQIAEEIERVGGYMNAYTSREHTAYYVKILKENLTLGVDILADILQNSTFIDEELSREKGVVIQEIGQANDTPDDIVWDFFQDTCFPNQPMGWSILGTTDTVNSFNSKMLKDYIGRNYSASNMVLSAAGNLNHEEVISTADKFFKNLPNFKAPTAKPSTYEGGNFSQIRDLEQIHWILGFEATALTHPQFYDGIILSTILGGGMSSRLFQEIREKRGLVYTISCDMSSYSDTGVFSIYAGTGKEHIKELISVVNKELDKVPSTLTEYEIGKAKTQIKANILMSMESMYGRCERLAKQVLTYGSPQDNQVIMGKIDKVNKESIINFMQSLYNKPSATTSLGPI